MLTALAPGRNVASLRIVCALCVTSPQVPVEPETLLAFKDSYQKGAKQCVIKDFPPLSPSYHLFFIFMCYSSFAMCN